MYIKHMVNSRTCLCLLIYIFVYVCNCKRVGDGGERTMTAISRIWFWIIGANIDYIALCALVTVLDNNQNCHCFSHFGGVNYSIYMRHGKLTTVFYNFLSGPSKINSYRANFCPFYVNTHTHTDTHISKRSEINFQQMSLFLYICVLGGLISQADKNVTQRTLPLANSFSNCSQGEPSLWVILFYLSMSFSLPAIITINISTIIV